LLRGRTIPLKIEGTTAKSITLVGQRRVKSLDRLIEDDMGDDPSIAMQRKEPVSTTERAGNSDDGKSTMGAGARQALQGYLAIMISISIFGASTFSSLISQFAEPTKFSIPTVRMFMGISWLFSVLTLAFGLTSNVLLGPDISMSKVMGRRFEQDSKLRTRAGVVLLFLTHFSIIWAFLFMALVVMAYTEGVGWVAVGITAAGTVGCFLIWSPILM